MSIEEVIITRALDGLVKYYDTGNYVIVENKAYKVCTPTDGGGVLEIYFVSKFKALAYLDGERLRLSN